MSSSGDLFGMFSLWRRVSVLYAWSSSTRALVMRRRETTSIYFALLPGRISSRHASRYTRKKRLPVAQIADTFDHFETPARISMSRHTRALFLMHACRLRVDR
ncbi:hypothetical protein V8C44DRAFT_340055 [Trichoderma aethiopicum]